MKLIIDDKVLAHLMTCLEVFVCEQQKRFQELASQKKVLMAGLIGWWKAMCLIEFSNCALDVPEFMVEIEEGKRGDIE